MIPVPPVAVAPAAEPGWRLVAADGVVPVPWKNGGGLTRELLRIDRPGSTAPDDWLLRISLADIEADGDFSRFAGVVRWFAVLEGTGVRLRWSAGAGTRGRERIVRPRQAPLRFDGADAPHCRLLDGPTRDLNVMVRADAADAELRLAQPGLAWSWARGPRGVFAQGALALRREGRAAVALGPRTLAWCDDGDTRPWSIDFTPTLHASPAQTDGPPAFWIGLALGPVAS